MNIQRHIRKVLNEEVSKRQEQIQKMINEVGFLQTSKVFGGIKRTLQLLGEELLTKKMKIEIINDLVYNNENEYITLDGMGENPYRIGKFDGEISQIEMLEPTEVVVYHYGGDLYDEELDEVYHSYRDLTNFIINDLFNMVINYYIREFEN